MELLASRCLPRSRNRARPKRQGLALAAISAGFLMITLDATIVNVALGAIGADLGGAPSVAQWVVDGYIVAFASLILLAGSLADRIGERRVCGRNLGRVADRSSSRAGHRCRLVDALLARPDRPHLHRAAGASPCA